jgi:hypothetical protein
MTVPMKAKILFGYAGRDVHPGAEFEAESERDAKLLNLLGKAEYRTAAIAAAPVQKPMKPATQLPTAPAGEATDETATLRAQYEALLGKRPFMGWGVDTLREKIAAKKAETAE